MDLKRPDLPAGYHGDAGLEIEEGIGGAGHIGLRNLVFSIKPPQPLNSCQILLPRQFFQLAFHWNQLSIQIEKKIDL